MSYQVFKPNRNNSGSAFRFNFGPDKKGNFALYVGAVLQHSWNSNTNTGSFKENAKDPQKSINTKLDEHEIGGIIFAISNLVEWKAYHSSPSGNVQFQFAPFYPEGQNFPAGYWLNLTRNKSEKFRIPLSHNELGALKEYLSAGLQGIFTNRIIEDNERRNNASQNGGGNQGGGNYQNRNGGNSQPSRQAPPEPEDTGGDENPFAAGSGDDSGAGSDNPFA